MDVRVLLAGGDRRSNRQSNHALAIVRLDEAKLPALLDCLWDADACIRMRASDALEKLSRDQAGLLQPFKKPLLDLALESTQKEVRWHLALILPRLRPTGFEAERVADLLESYLTDRSSIVKTFAMQGLADLAKEHTEFRTRVTEIIRSWTKTGTPAMRARGRILLRKCPAD
jgi:hypothetical protein